jgi:hypothetical protein
VDVGGARRSPALAIVIGGSFSMASGADRGKEKQGELSPRSARAQMEEALGRLDLTEEE